MVRWPASIILNTKDLMHYVENKFQILRNRAIYSLYLHNQCCIYEN